MGTHIHCAKIKVIIPPETLLFYIIIYHKDDITCLQLKKNSETVIASLCLSLSFYKFPTEKFCSNYFYREVVCVRNCIEVPEVGRKSVWSGCTINRPILPPSFASWDGLHEHWQPWRSQVHTNNDEDSFSVSLYRLTRGLVGPAGNVWVQRGPSPRKKVAPQSLPTSWEIPMPLVSPQVLSCRIHVSSPSSKSHTAWVLQSFYVFNWKGSFCMLIHGFVKLTWISSHAKSTHICLAGIPKK